MKRLLFTFIYLLFNHVGFSQMEWVGNHEFSDEVNSFVRTAQNQYVLLHGNGITVFDSLGTIIFSTPLYSDNVSELVATPDTSVILFAEFFECDLLVEEIIKFDKNWEMEWTSSYAYGVEQVAFASDSAIYASGYGPSISRMDLNANGPAIWETYLNDGHWVEDLKISFDGKILSCSSAGLSILNPDGSIDTVLENLNFNRLELDELGFYYALKKDSILWLTQDFDSLAIFVSPNYSIVDYSINDDLVWVLTDEPRLYKLTKNLSAINDFLISSHNQAVQFVLPIDSNALIAGKEQFGYGNWLSSNTSAFMKTYLSDGGTLDSQEDIGLTNISINGQTTVKYDGVPNFNVPFAVTFHDIRIEVENFGPATVNNLNLNIGFPDFPVPFWCPINQRFSKPFFNLDLQPGESTELVWGDLEIYFEADPSGMLDLCFWTSVPNHHLETNNDNDLLCTQVLVAVNEPQSLDFTAIFNPSTNQVFFNLAPAMQGVPIGLTVFNAAGQAMAKSPVFTGPAFNMANLTDGLYLIRLHAGESVGWAKVVKY